MYLASCKEFPYCYDRPSGCCTLWKRNKTMANQASTAPATRLMSEYKDSARGRNLPLFRPDTCGNCHVRKSLWRDNNIGRGKGPGWTGQLALDRARLPNCWLVCSGGPLRSKSRWVNLEICKEAANLKRVKVQET